MLQKWHLGFKTWKYTPTERGFDSHLGYYAGSTDYYTQDSLCWPDSQCFTSFTPTHEPVSGWDLHRDRETIRNSTLYSTTLYLPLILHRGLYAPVFAYVFTACVFHACMGEESAWVPGAARYTEEAANVIARHARSDAAPQKPLFLYLPPSWS